MKLSLKFWLVYVGFFINLSCIIAMTDMDYKEPVFNQFVFDQNEGISFQKIVTVHNQNREETDSMLVLSESEPFVYGSDYQNPESDDSEQPQSSFLSSSSSGGGGGSFSTMSQSTQSSQTTTQSDLYYFMNAEQYDESNGIREDLMYSVND